MVAARTGKKKLLRYEFTIAPSHGGGGPRGTGISKKNVESIGKELLDVRDKAGALTADTALERAKSPKSPLHPLITWDDAVAGPAFRRIEMAGVIRSVRIRVVSEPVSTKEYVVRAFMSVARDPDDETAAGQGRRYEETVVLMADTKTRQQVIQQALEELNQWRARYVALAEFAELFGAITKAMKNLV